MSRALRAWATLVTVLVGCAPPAPTAKVRRLELPAAYDRASSGPSVARLDWRTFFADAQLASLITEALAANPDLQIALQRIELARAGVRRATGALLPEISVAAGAGVQRFGTYTMDGAGNATTEITPGRLVPNPLGDLSVGLQTSWELDLWGKLRTLRGSARAQYLASIEGANLVITNLVTEIATAYFELLALDHTRDILQADLERQLQALEMMRLQKQAGRTNELAVQQFEAEVASTRALEAAVLQQVRELEHTLCVLAGRLPGPIARDKSLLEREVPSTLAAGVPSELLRNRPDIREAELQLMSAELELSAARAAFYPRLRISADLGYQAFNPRYLLSTPESVVASLAANLVAPLVNRRGIEADFAAASAIQVQAMYAYQGVVLRSFAEVASGLSALEQAAQIVAHQKLRHAATERVIETAGALFRAGKATYLDVLVAQQASLEARLSLVEALKAHHVARIRVYKALGGGWHGQLDVQP